ncbi:hypothetical protein LTR12_015381 [Friedmanniomyces endolithicus]|nr:hypothetical protein LTR12_015381 [Friedmanniomyces endolithicus]
MFEPDRKKSPGKLFAMLAYEAVRNQRHSRRPYSYPPRQYFDLTKADIVALASVLIAPPPPYSSASAAFPHEIRRIRRTIEHELHMHWTPLSAEGSLTTAQGHLITRLNLHTWHVNGNTCTACALSRFAIDITLLLALGALTLATLSPHNWRKSKRLFFLESQLQLLHDLRLGSNAETSKQDMFEPGSELRRIRERLRLLHDRRSSDRPHVAEAVTRYYSASAPPPRPPRSPEQEDHVLISANLSPKDGRLAEIAELMSSGGGTTSKSTVRRKPVPATGRKVSVFDEAFQEVEKAGGGGQEVVGRLERLGQRGGENVPAGRQRAQRYRGISWQRVCRFLRPGPAFHVQPPEHGRIRSGFATTATTVASTVLLVQARSDHRQPAKTAWGWSGDSNERARSGRAGLKRMGRK